MTESSKEKCTMLAYLGFVHHYDYLPSHGYRDMKNNAMMASR
jgi:hypothetical protein